MLNIAVLVSGGGTNLQALLDAEKDGRLPNGRIVCVISSKEGAYALDRAAKAGKEGICIPRRAFASMEEYDRALLDALEGRRIDLIVLAGFLSILGDEVVARYRNRIINVHPALIPSFCGKGYYGLKVHQAALEKGVKVTGATVHFVNEIPDGGAIILQQAVEVHDDDTPESLQKRVMVEAEWKLLPCAVALFCEGRLRVEGGRVRILQESPRQ